MAEDSPGSSFTDDDYRFLRHVRFGEMPPAVRPEERTALTETDPRRDQPDPGDERDRWDLRHGA
ncbi:hypothetical protein V6U77_29015 [Micromonospora sp. CPCC 205546]|uniref:hypothetical protein n=1 Tax=Micromonospora sp. CPCC 205546 TaxID=3122397 RepID=UPI002FF2AB05